MKTIGTKFKKLIILLVTIIILIGGISFYFKDKLNNIFGGTNTAEYEFVIKRFSKQVKLVVADAETNSTRKQKFSSNTTKDWPKWTKPITKVFIGRDIVVKIPVTTEFKIDLKNITSKDIKIENGVLTFKHPLTVEVDSQRDGDVKIEKQSSGIIDKGVDLFTSSAKAQEFFDEKTQETVFRTSKYVLDKKKDKIISYAEESLSQMINLNSENKIEVKLNEKSLNFKIVDKK
ncbi:hypothetical protein ACVRWQ_04010 [Streptococcus phocae subsp. salmonis]|uniref:hypothetical protein n=1 Tax=Streptococcus phocae TaxID=119224 RepID=UPI000530BDBE|nr:hypothetical protein [Streptococcus phocae]KGR73272.1 hypothetical protein NX86_01395 [Streptococcus phocae subsp. salmonis]